MYRHSAARRAGSRGTTAGYDTVFTPDHLGAPAPFPASRRADAAPGGVLSWDSTPPGAAGLAGELEPVDVDEVAAGAGESEEELVDAGGAGRQCGGVAGPGLPAAGVADRHAGDDGTG